MRHRKFIDASSEDLLSNYNAINYNKTNRKNNGSNFAGHITKQPSIVNHTKMKTYQTTSFSFFNVFFDIVFWPFVFFRAKQWLITMYSIINPCYLLLRISLLIHWCTICNIIMNDKHERKTSLKFIETCGFNVL